MMQLEPELKLRLMLIQKVVLATTAHLRLFTGDTTGLYQRLAIASNGDISFYEDTGTTAKLFWDASAESF
jgi:hypothetical protein